MGRSVDYLSRSLGVAYFALQYLGTAEDNPEDDDNGTPLGYSNSNGQIRHYKEVFPGENQTRSKPYYS